MNEIGKLLKEGDPLASEPALSLPEIQGMRRAVVAGEVATRQVSHWPPPVVVAATIALTLTASVVLGRRLTPRQEPALSSGRGASQAGDSVMPGPARRQLQFATPGGTRIIWVFNPDFSL